jgi:hypothetical protein
MEECRHPEKLHARIGLSGLIVMCRGCGMWTESYRTPELVRNIYEWKQNDCVCGHQCFPGECTQRKLSKRIDDLEARLKRLEDKE